MRLRRETSPLTLLVLFALACGGEPQEAPPPVAPGGPGVASAEYQAKRQAMLDAYRGGDPRAAMRPALEALLLAPQDDEPYATLSSLYQELGDDAGAAAFFEKAATAPAFAGRPQPHLYAGFHRFRLNEWDDALAAYRRAGELAPQAAEPPFRQGLILQTLGSFDEAAVALRRARKLNPADPIIAARLARLLRITGDYDGSLAVVQSALATMPDSPDLHQAHGMLLQRAGDLPAAESALRRAIELNPRYREAHHELARVLRKQGNAEEGAREEAIAARLAAYMERVDVLTRDAAARPGSYEPPLQLAALEADEGQWETAARWLERARALGAPADDAARLQRRIEAGRGQDR